MGPAPAAPRPPDRHKLLAVRGIPKPTIFSVVETATPFSSNTSRPHSSSTSARTGWRSTSASATILSLTPRLCTSTHRDVESHRDGMLFSLFFETMRESVVLHNAARRKVAGCATAICEECRSGRPSARPSLLTACGPSSTGVPQNRHVTIRLGPPHDRLRERPRASSPAPAAVTHQHPKDRGGGVHDS